MKKVYLDANATTKAFPEVVEAMMPFFSKKFGNASSVHSFGREAKKHLEKARRSVASFINAEYPEEVIFTSGGTEANNAAIKGVHSASGKKEKHIISSNVEHLAVLNVCKGIEEKGVGVTYLGVDKNGIIDLKELERSIKNETILITLIAANNETGSVMPIKTVGDIASDRGVYFHIDAVQYAGKVPLDVQKTGISLASISGHKINGPKGVGALYVKKGVKISGYLQGGHQEMNKRAGTETLPGIVGFSKACKINQEKQSVYQDKVYELRNELFDRINAEITGVTLNGHPEHRLPNTLNVSFEGVDKEALVMGLDLEGIAISAGSACTSGSVEDSHVLKAMGVAPELRKGAVRFSMDMFNKKEDIEYLMEKLPVIVKRIRNKG